MLGCARLSCSAKCSGLCWTRNIPRSRLHYLPLFGERTRVPPREGGGSDSRNRQNEAYSCNIFSLVNQPGNDDVTFTTFSTPFFQQYYSHNTGYYGQESEAYTYTYPTGTPAQEQTQLQETNNIDLEKVMGYIECCVMLLFIILLAFFLVASLHAVVFLFIL